jgi:type I restriction enzyme, S subunit
MKKQWPMVKLGEVLIEQKERIGSIDANELPLLGVSNQEGLHRSGMPRITDMSRYLRVERDWFAYNPMRINVGSIGWAQTQELAGVISPDYVVFSCSERILPRLLIRFLKHRRGLLEINKVTAGSVRERLYFDKLAQIEFPLPPMNEQRRVVTRIEELTTQISEARILRDMATEETEAVVSARSAEIFRDSASQGTVPLESIAILERGKFSHRPRNEPRFFGGNHPWIQIGEIESAGKMISRWTTTLNDEGLAISKKFPKGTVLISIAATIGSVGILDFDCCIPDSIVGVTPREGTDSEFLYYFLGFLRGHLEEIAPQSAQKNINLQILAPLPVPKMALAVQRRIVAELDALQAEVDELKAVQAETSVELNALLPSILDRAFRGEL